MSTAICKPPRTQAKRQVNEQGRPSLQSPSVPPRRGLHIVRLHRRQASRSPHYKPCRRTESYSKASIKRLSRLVEVSTDQVAELSERLALAREAIARIETRQTVILDLLERSQASLGEYHGRLTNMERDAHTIKTKLWLVALVSGAVFSTIWELIKRRISF